MSTSERLPRRRFLQGVAGAGAAVAGHNAAASPTVEDEAAGGEGPARQAWIGTVSQDGLRARDSDEMVDLLLERFDAIMGAKPDLICFPEMFQYSNTDAGRPAVRDAAEAPLGELGRRVADYAKSHGCYAFYSGYTEEGGRFYNSAVLIDRGGAYVGAYHKMHPTIGEMEKGISPGPLDPPVFDTDFGRLGAQICFDIEWDDGWKKLADAGAEIVVWQSAFAGGRAINSLAARNRYVVVTSCRKDTSKVCDVTGEVIAATGRFSRAVCAPVNLEKAFLHTWPYNRRFEEIHAKYGRKVRIHTLHEEEWSVIESLSADVRVADVLKEFEIDTYGELMARATRLQDAARRTS
ncbi:carbon-nitrogen hydrolase family protein [Botrimarina sp.]|uniref:carbon-nitrogen hydrolase family protein n=1 Tax=Botrimarina sp. TaxID=2795802 RepID=UPI0032EDAE37